MCFCWTWLDCVFRLLMFIHVPFHFSCTIMRQLLAQCLVYRFALKIASRSCYTNGNGVYPSLVGFDSMARRSNLTITPNVLGYEKTWLPPLNVHSISMIGLQKVPKVNSVPRTMYWLRSSWLPSAISRKPRQASFWNINPTNIAGKELWRLWSSTRTATSCTSLDRKPWKLFKGLVT